jgi:hypothetical protein
MSIIEIFLISFIYRGSFILVISVIHYTEYSVGFTMLIYIVEIYIHAGNYLTKFANVSQPNYNKIFITVAKVDKPNLNRCLSFLPKFKKKLSY